MGCCYMEYISFFTSEYYCTVRICCHNQTHNLSMFELCKNHQISEIIGIQCYYSKCFGLNCELLQLCSEIEQIIKHGKMSL